MLAVLIAAWLTLALPELDEADGPLDALTKHAAAVVAAATATPSPRTP